MASAAASLETYSASKKHPTASQFSNIRPEIGLLVAEQELSQMQTALG